MFSRLRTIGALDGLILLPCYAAGWRRQWHPTPVLLPGKSHGWRSLVDCSPWGREESDMTERLHFHFSLSCIGEGNGNPLQCSCLENPRDRGAWLAAIYGVAQSRTRLKRLSSSSSSSIQQAAKVGLSEKPVKRMYARSGNPFPPPLSRQASVNVFRTWMALIPFLELHSKSHIRFL